MYVGITENLKKRLEIHNAGGSVHTSKYKSWDLVVYIGFKDEGNARGFEKYLKSGSGRAFTKKHLSTTMLPIAHSSTELVRPTNQHKKIKPSFVKMKA